jgi:hypothetical protein
MSFKAIEKIYSNLIQLSTNDVEKSKIITKLIETLPAIKSKNCCFALLSMIFEYVKQGHFDSMNFANLLMNLINSKQEKLDKNYLYFKQFNNLR